MCGIVVGKREREREWEMPLSFLYQFERDHTLCVISRFFSLRPEGLDVCILLLIAY